MSHQPGQLHFALVVCISVMFFAGCGGSSSPGSVPAAASVSQGDTGESAETAEPAEEPADVAVSSATAVDTSGRPTRLVLASSSDPRCETECASTVQVVGTDGELVAEHQFEYSVHIQPYSYPGRIVLSTTEPAGTRLHLLNLETNELWSDTNAYELPTVTLNLVGPRRSPYLWWNRPDQSALIDIERMTVQPAAQMPFSLDGTRLALADGETLEVRDQATFELLQTVPLSDAWTFAGLSPDGTTILAQVRAEAGEFETWLVPADSPDSEPVRVLEDTFPMGWYDDDRVLLLPETRLGSIFLLDLRTDESGAEAQAAGTGVNATGSPWHIEIDDDADVFGVVNIETGERLEREKPADEFSLLLSPGQLPNVMPDNFMWVRSGRGFDPPGPDFVAVRIDLRTGEQLRIDNAGEQDVAATLLSSDASQLLLFRLFDTQLVTADGSQVTLPFSLGGHFCRDGSFALLTIPDGASIDESVPLAEAFAAIDTDVSFYATAPSEPTVVGSGGQVVCSSN